MNDDVQQKLHSTMDTVGTYISSACAVHCLLLPFVLTLLPLIGLGFLGDHDFEKMMLLCTVSLALLSLCWGTRIHRKHRVLALPGIALLLFAGGLSTEDKLSHSLPIALGGACLAMGHYLNKRLCRTCKDCHECECEPAA